MKRITALFDRPVTSQSFFSAKVGLFGYADLKTPRDFPLAANRTIVKATRLMNAIVDRPAKKGWTSDDHLKLTVKRLDRLSDMLCVVVDTAELIRNVHPDKEFVTAANSVHEHLSNFLNILNTHQGLYSTLKQASVAFHSSWDFDEQSVGQLLLTDFEKSGIHLQKSQREQFIQLNNSILQSGQEFMLNGCTSDAEYISFKDPKTSLLGLDTSHIHRLSSSSANEAHVPIQSYSAYQILKHCRCEETRKRMYLSMNKGSDRQVQVLQNILQNRQKVAELVGFTSYGHLWLRDKMVQTPENVLTFLKTQQENLFQNAKEELLQLETIKNSHATHRNGLNAWDKHFYASLIPPKQNSSYKRAVPSLTIGQTMEALNWLYKKLFGISLEPCIIHSGEVWHDQVRKLNVLNENRDIIGIIYCDLFERPEPKFNGAAHFTVKCSRNLDFDPMDTFFENEEPVFHNTAHVFKTHKNENFQLPVVVLNTQFAYTSASPTQLSSQEVETVFHEMGHALHSMLAKTRFQHISGTRVAMDCVEVPSILLEQFSTPRIIQMFRNEVYGEHVDLESIALAEEPSALESMHQIQMALIDQRYHSAEMMVNGRFDTNAILEETVNQFGLIPHATGARWQCGFTHLFTYGASYYSYAWSRLIANRIWDKLFDRKYNYELDAWRSGGDLLQKELLSVGGGRNAWDCLNNMNILKNGEMETKTFIV